MNWKSIIATAMITGAVTVITGMILFWWQSDKSELTYNSIQSIPFDDASNSLYIQQVEIRNSGDKPVDDVILSISFTEEVIEKSRIVINKAISHKKESNENSITLRIDSLNPNEGANVSVLYKSNSSSSSGAAISLRGKGVTGKLIGSSENSEKILLLIALIAAYTGMFSVFISTKGGRHVLPLIVKGLLFKESIGGDQKHEIASALSLYGYPEKAREYLNSSADRQYWVEADLLAAEALIGDEKLKKDTIKILIMITDIPNIVSTSKAIAFYNIARIHKSLRTGDETVNEYLNLAIELDKPLINSRVSRDPVFSPDQEPDIQLHAVASGVVPVN